MAITTKAGLLANLRNLKWFADCDCGEILPRGYDLSVETDVLVRNDGDRRILVVACAHVPRDSPGLYSMPLPSGGWTLEYSIFSDVRGCYMRWYFSSFRSTFWRSRVHMVSKYFRSVITRMTVCANGSETLCFA